MYPKQTETEESGQAPAFGRASPSELRPLRYAISGHQVGREPYADPGGSGGAVARSDVDQSRLAGTADRTWLGSCCNRSDRVQTDARPTPSPGRRMALPGPRTEAMQLPRRSTPFRTETTARAPPLDESLGAGRRGGFDVVHLDCKQHHIARARLPEDPRRSARCGRQEHPSIGKAARAGAWRRDPLPRAK